MDLYFFLQEEMCFNITTQKEQPLALQKLMMLHVKAGSSDETGPKTVKYISENDLKSQQGEKFEGMEELIYYD